jgi:hypothetical protein
MQNEKSLGKNGTPPEAYKNLYGKSLDRFVVIIIKFFEDANYNPPDWQDIKLKLLPKSGDLKNPNKWKRHHTRRHRVEDCKLYHCNTTNKIPVYFWN